MMMKGLTHDLERRGKGDMNKKLRPHKPAWWDADVPDLCIELKKQKSQRHGKVKYQRPVIDETISHV